MADLGFGMMRLPLKDQDDQKSIDMDLLERMVDTYLDAGFDYFDTAYMYHDNTSEYAVRDALVRRHPRDSFRLASKMPLMTIATAEDQERIFDEQLEKCGVDYFDYYMAHNYCQAFRGPCDELDTFGFLVRKKAEGKIGKIGFSFHDGPELLEEVLSNHPEVEFVQLQINYFDWDNPSIQSRKCYEVARKHNVPIIIMEPVKGGALANVPDEVERMFASKEPGMSPASWALRFAASLEGVETVLSGMSTLEQVNDNLSFMRDLRKLDEGENRMVLEAADIIRSKVAIQCTACRYCMKSCPQDILIAEYFSLYNAEKADPPKGFSIQSLYYQNLSKNHGLASSCVECGNCETNCPQHLPVIDLLKNVADLFESGQ